MNIRFPLIQFSSSVHDLEIVWDPTLMMIFTFQVNSVSRFCTIFTPVEGFSHCMLLLQWPDTCTLVNLGMLCTMPFLPLTFLISVYSEGPSIKDVRRDGGRGYGQMRTPADRGRGGKGSCGRPQAGTFLYCFSMLWMMPIKVQSAY